MARDLRKYASKTSVQLIAGGVVILFVVGLGLIAWFYGWNAALLGFVCMLGGLVLIGLVALLMFGLEFFVKKINKD